MGGNSSSAASESGITHHVPRAKPVVRRVPVQEPRGVKYVMPLEPGESPLFYRCPNCDESCFDGNVARRLMCRCGLALIRMEDGLINAQGHLAIDSFDSLFHVRTQFPSTPQIPRLHSISLAIFRESIPSNPVFTQIQIMNDLIMPYFVFKARCIGINDLIQIGYLKVKVVAAVPAFGVVAKDTEVVCQDLVTQQPLRKVLIAALPPAEFTTPSFRETVMQHYKSRKFGHLHTGQELYFNGIEAVVEAAEPADGLLTPTTEFYYDERPLPQVQTLLCRTINRQAASLGNATGQRLNNILREQFLIPILQGRRMPVHTGCEFQAADVTFKVMDSRPPRGWVGPETQIALTTGSQEEDPRLQLLEQLLQLSHMLEAAGAQLRGLDSTHADVIATLPTRVLSTSMCGESNKCMICISEYEVGHKVTTLPCCK